MKIFPIPLTKFARLCVPLLLEWGTRMRGDRDRRGHHGDHAQGNVDGWRVLYLSVDAIRANPDQPRKYFEPEARELAESIGRYGICSR